MEKPRHLHVYVAEQFAEVLPDYFKQRLELDKEGVATVVWLVGFAATAFALLVGNWYQLDFFGPAERGILLATLAAVVVLGSAQRIAEFRKAQAEVDRQRAVIDGLMVLTRSPAAPAPLFREWGREEVMRRIEFNFGKDFYFMLDLDLTDAGARDLYKRELERWEKANEHGVKELGIFAAAMVGKEPEDSPFADLDLSSDKASGGYSFDGLRKDAREASKWQRMASKLFTAAIVVFMAAVVEAVLFVLL